MLEKTEIDSLEKECEMRRRVSVEKQLWNRRDTKRREEFLLPFF